MSEMSDIVERLRAAAKCRARGGKAWADYEDAADEIERLRSLLVSAAIPASLVAPSERNGGPISSGPAPQLRKVPRMAKIGEP